MLEPMKRRRIWSYGYAVLNNELTKMTFVYSILLVVVFLPVVLGHQTMDAMNSMPGVLGRSFLAPGNAPFADGAAAGAIEDPLNVLVASDWAHGQIPFWDPYAGFGMPLAANAQTAAWFFPEIVAHILLPHQAWSVYNLVRILVACLGAFWLGRLFKLSLIAAFFAGMLYGLGGAMLPNQAMNYANIMALFPWLIGVGMCWARDQAVNAWLVLLAVLTGGIMTGGMPEASALTLVFGYSFILAFGLWIIGMRWKSVIGLVIAGLLGVGLTAMATLPFVEYLKTATTAHTNTTGLKHNPLWTVVVNFSPRIVPPVGTVLHLPMPDVMLPMTGGILMLLSVSVLFRQLWKRWKPHGLANPLPQREKTLLLMTAVLFMAPFFKEFGVWPFQVLGYLPIFNLVAWPRFGAIVWALPATMLAAAGLDYVFQRVVCIRDLFVAGIVALIAVTGFTSHVMTVAMMHRMSVITVAAGMMKALGLGTLAMAVVSLSVLTRPKISLKSIFPALIGLLMCVEVGSYAQVGWPYGVPSYPMGVGVKWIKDHVHPVERILTVGTPWVLEPNTPGVFGVATVDNFGPMYPTSEVKFVSAYLDRTAWRNQMFEFQGASVTSHKGWKYFSNHARLLAKVGIQFVVSNRRLPYPLPATLRLVRHFRQFFVYAVQGSWAIHSIPGQWPITASHVTIEANNKMYIQGLPRGSSITLAEQYSPGWTATTSKGAIIPISQVGNLPLMSIRATQSTDSIRLTYTPPYWALAVDISTLAAAVLLVMLVFSMVRTKLPG